MILSRRFMIWLQISTLSFISFIFLSFFLHGFCHDQSLIDHIHISLLHPPPPSLLICCFSYHGWSQIALIEIPQGDWERLTKSAMQETSSALLVLFCSVLLVEKKYVFGKFWHLRKKFKWEKRWAVLWDKGVQMNRKQTILYINIMIVFHW